MEAPEWLKELSEDRTRRGKSWWKRFVLWSLLGFLLFLVGFWCLR